MTATSPGWSWRFESSGAEVAEETFVCVRCEEKMVRPGFVLV